MQVQVLPGAPRLLLGFLRVSSLIQSSLRGFRCHFAATFCVLRRACFLQIQPCARPDGGLENRANKLEYPVSSHLTHNHTVDQPEPQLARPVDRSLKSPSFNRLHQFQRLWWMNLIPSDGSFLARYQPCSSPFSSRTVRKY